MLEKEFETEHDNLKKKHQDALIVVKKEFEKEKLHIKEKFAMQLSNLLQNDKSFGELDEREENRKLSVN
jgi:hypothetical protein